MLGAWAEQVGRVQIGALLTCNSYRNLELLADMARTVDHISGGRLIFGIGADWFEKDHDQFVHEFDVPGTRIAELASALSRITTRLAIGNPAHRCGTPSAPGTRSPHRSVIPDEVGLRGP